MIFNLIILTLENKSDILIEEFKTNNIIFKSPQLRESKKFYSNREKTEWYETHSIYVGF